MDNTYVRVKVYDKNLEEQIEGKVDLIGKVLPEKMFLWNGMNRCRIFT